MIELVVSRLPLPYCGAEVTGEFSDDNPYEYIEVVAGAHEGYRERAKAGQPAVIISVGFTSKAIPTCLSDPDARRSRGSLF